MKTIWIKKDLKREEQAEVNELRIEVKEENKNRTDQGKE